MNRSSPEPQPEPHRRLPRWLNVARKQVINVSLILISLAIAAGSAEVALRIIAPKYQRPADAKLEFDSFRLKSHTPLTAVRQQRPDTGQPHLTIYNSLGMRQHREFAANELDRRTVVAFFGDSFTENNRIPAYASFTEVLDFLLNDNPQDTVVMNFGVDGYGPDQSYLQYQSSAEAKTADHVFYVFCANDVRNLYENGLFSLGDSGQLRRNIVREPSLFLRAISRLYLTYFILDARSVVRSLLTGRPHHDYTAEDVLGYQANAVRRKNFRSARAIQIQEKFQTKEWNDVSHYIDMLLAITRTWRDLVEQNGGQFHIVLLPREGESVAEDLFRGAFSVINLYGLFSDMVPGYDYEMIRFREDPHWDETGNMLAAIALYREISRLRGRTAADALTVAARLRTYYSSFDGWYPADLPLRLPFSAEMQSIRDRYLELEAEPGVRFN
jgi:hypothetical protein